MQRVKVNEKSFEGQPIYVGIDYDKSSWKVCWAVSTNTGPWAGSRIPTGWSGIWRATFPGLITKLSTRRVSAGLGLNDNWYSIEPLTVRSSNWDKSFQRGRLPSKELCGILCLTVVQKILTPSLNGLYRVSMSFSLVGLLQPSSTNN